MRHETWVRLQSIQQSLDAVERLCKTNALTLASIDRDLQKLTRVEMKMSQAIDDLTSEVAAGTAVDESAITLIEGFTAKLTELADAIAAQGADNTAIIKARDDLHNSTEKLAAAVAANTPAAP